MPTKKNKQISLSSKSNLEAIKTQVEDILDYNKSKEARILYKKIEASIKRQEDFKEKDPELYREWQNILVKLKWIAFPFLNFEDVIELFRDGLADAFNIEDYSLEGNLKITLLTIPLWEERDNYKKRIREAMLKNSQLIASKDILLKEGKVKPTISNWLKLYNQTLGTGKIEKLKRAEFFTKNAEFLKLSAEEKAKVKRLFGLYERLKLSSSEPEGMEEGGAVRRGDRLEIVNEGQIQDIVRLKPEVPSKGLEKRANLPPESSGEKKFEFDMEKDVKEVKKIEKKSPKIEAKTINIDELVNKASQETNLTFNNQVLKKRFANIISAYIKDVRDERETKDTLMRAKKVGGMELTEAKASQIIDILKAKKPQLKRVEVKLQHAPPKETEWVPKPPKPKEYEKMLWRVEHKSVIAEPGKEKKAPARGSGEEVAKAQKEYKKPAITKTQKQKTEEQKEPESKPPQPKRYTLNATPSPNIQKVEDVKPPPQPSGSESPTSRVTGPIEELKALRLVDFRRWSSNPKDSMARIEQKINLLGEENLTKRVAGIRAWQESEIYKLYVALGDQSLKESKSLEQVIEERTSQNQPTLTMAEFKAINELNQKLRF